MARRSEIWLVLILAPLCSRTVPIRPKVEGNLGLATVSLKQVE